ncbi:hypothetical protein DL96DRAFT_1067810 [Flagelloscypha sp. PMI_526]|nr:hypothetical protein DL96DRAFT_1067810 [Flagelloscypha sp. PMI_526]
MPRRAPPSRLHLHPGPTPPRGTPKYQMPIMPQSVFRPRAPSDAPSTRPSHRRSSSRDSLSSEASSPSESGWSSLNSSPTSSTTNLAFTLNGSNSSSSLSLPMMPMTPATPASWRERTVETKKVLRGPWDHSGTITDKLSLDVESLLKPLQPVATTY